MENHAFAKLENFFSKFKKLSFRKGETILRADEEPRGVLYLKKGYVRLYSLSKNAQELTLMIFKPEDFFPLMWAINGTPNNYYVEAMTAVEAYQAPREEFLKTIKDCELLLEIHSRVLARFGGLMNRMEYAIFGNAYHKVASIILLTADRLGIKAEKGIFIPVPLTHQDIARLLGVARETVSIEMKKMQKEGVTGYQGKHLIIKDYQKLKEQSALEETN